MTHRSTTVAVVARAIPLLLGLYFVVLPLERAAIAADAPPGAAPRVAEAVHLVRQGASATVIVVRAEASASERRGAGEIQAMLKSMSGAQLAIVNDAQPLPQAAILVGFTRYTRELANDIDPAKLGAEGFVIRTVGPHVLIAGGPVRGAMYGCTGFLEMLGVNYLVPDLTVVPSAKDISLPACNRTEIPAFEYREPYITEAFGKEWAAHLRTNGSAQHLDDSTGGKVRYSHFVHTFDDLIPRARFASHPEYFPLIKGKRTDGYVQRCLSNPEVLKLAKATVLKWIATDPKALIYSVSQNDVGKWCECDACKAITEKYGGAHAGLYLWFVNEVADEVAKQHPDKLIDTLAYQFTEPAPTGIVPRKNVRVRLCPIACCYAHPFEKCAFPATVKFMEALTRWAKITDTLYIWHYNTNFANYLMPFPNFDEFPASVRLYQRSGVKGIFFEGDYAGGGGGSFAELQAYVMAKLMWNPQVDDVALVKQWHQGVFNKAALPMLRWFELLHEKARVADKHFGIYSPPTIHYLSDDVIAQGDELFKEAQQLAGENGIAQRYIAKAHLGLRYVKLMRKPTTGPELDAFLADVKKFKITQLREGQPVEAWEKQYRAKVK